MHNFIKLFFLPLVLSTCVSFLITKYVIKFANKFGLIDDPKKSNHPKVIHTYPVPRAGGLSIFISLLVSSVIFLPIDKHTIGILLGAIVLTILGLLDDKHNLNPYKRLLIQFFAAGIPIAFGVGIAFANLPFIGHTDLSHPQITFKLFGQIRNIWIFSDIFALFWIVILMNFLNMGAKGVDGQLPGVAFLASVTIAALSINYSADITQWPVIILASITAGAFLGFLPWNYYPQKIMPGFSGSSLAGFLLAILSILATAKIGTLLVVLGIPLIDTGYTIIRRLASGKSPVWGDRGHLHHKLLDLGLSKSQVTIVYWVATFILAILALNLNASYKFYTIVGVATILGGFLLWLTYRSN
ncbi:undecaprenyl/decaprenyl-phosphate alpha-N-acetylglucosaminyl 1-phosphate transferase [Candidatus Woesebacteria bacterium]|nr:undecaprenyl/decaprenyl-phosphate alpha-N-acetylglucosaminyl 1-phosphate transferase [Candidatus Woesebacteria bacterium]